MALIFYYYFYFFRTERDATNWSSDKLKSLIVGLTVENEEGSCEVTEVNKLEGEASINNRKGKLIFFYEWNLKANWTGEQNPTLFTSYYDSNDCFHSCYCWIEQEVNPYSIYIHIIHRSVCVHISTINTSQNKNEQ